MKNILIPAFILVIGILGFTVYKNSELKRQTEFNQLIQEEVSAGDTALPFRSNGK